MSQNAALINDFEVLQLGVEALSQQAYSLCHLRSLPAMAMQGGAAKAPLERIRASLKAPILGHVNAP